MDGQTPRDCPLRRETQAGYLFTRKLSLSIGERTARVRPAPRSRISFSVPLGDEFVHISPNKELAHRPVKQGFSILCPVLWSGQD